MRKIFTKIALSVSALFLLNFSMNAQAGAAVSFDGTKDLLAIPSNTLLNLGDFTLEYWIKHTGTDAGYDRITSTTGDAFETAKDGAGAIKYYMGTWVSVTTVTLNTWAHLAWVRKANVITLYKNGVSTYTAAVTTAAVPGTAWRVGIRSNGGGELANMAMDELRIWNRALCQGEIQNNMNCEIATTSTGLVLNYHFNAGTAGGNNTGVTSVADFSGSALTGTLTNLTLTGAVSNWIAPGGVTSGVSCSAFAGASISSFSGVQSLCVNGNTSLTANTTAPTPTITWYNAAVGGTLLSTGATYATPTLTNTTTYYVSVASGACSSATRTPVTVSVNPLPVVTASASGSVICLGTSITLNGGGASTYTWTGGVTNNVAFTPSISTTYTVVGTDANGCSSSATKSITVYSLPAVTASASSSAFCLGNLTTLNGGGAITYTWSGGVTNNVAFTPTVSATYTVIGTGANGCTNSATKSITVNPLPAVTASASSSVICLGTSITLNGGGASTYTWTGGVTNNVAFTPTVSTTYTVVGIDVNGCSNSASKSITVYSLPVVTASASGSVICLGNTTTLNGGGAITYTWSGGVTNNVAFTPTVSATYTVIGTGANGCTNSATKSITVNPLPAVTASASASVLCLGDSTTLSGGGAVTYIWTGGVTNNVAFTPTVSATYTVVGTDANGCSNSASNSITVNALPTLNIATSSSLICVGQTATLTAGGASTYTWNTSANGVSISVSPTVTTTYTVTGTDVNGCMNSTVSTQSVSLCLGINSQQTSSKNGFVFYPNPSNGVIIINSDEEMIITVYNELAQPVQTLSIKGNESNKIDLSDLNQGVYYLVSESVHKSETQKLIIIK